MRSPKSPCSIAVNYHKQFWIDEMQDFGGSGMKFMFFLV